MSGHSDLPIIDVRALRDRPSADRMATISQIGLACRDTGFFYVTGHGICTELMSDVFDAMHRLFEQPMPVKSALSIESSRHNRGYVAHGGEQLEASRPGDLKEAFNIGFELPADDPEVVADVPFRGPNQWPQGMPRWRQTVLTYFDSVLRLAGDLHRAFTCDLGVDESFFVSAMERPLAVLRLLHYPPVPGVHAGEGEAIGAGTHTDYGMLTLLAQDEIGGLQVQRRDGTWIDAPVVPDAFICNIGDMLMRWSNDVYVSTPHRVVNHPTKNRYSVAMFCDPAPDAAVVCLPTCCSETRPPRYAPTTSAAYLTDRLDATYAFRSKASQ